MQVFETCRSRFESCQGRQVVQSCEFSGEIREASLCGVRVPKLTAVNEFGTQLVRFQLHTTQFNAQVVELVYTPCSERGR
jgi:hypothetical protein